MTVHPPVSQSPGHKQDVTLSVGFIDSIVTCDINLCLRSTLICSFYWLKKRRVILKPSWCWIGCLEINRPCCKRTEAWREAEMTCGTSWDSSQRKTSKSKTGGYISQQPESVPKVILWIFKRHLPRISWDRPELLDCNSRPCPVHNSWCVLLV